MPPTVQAGKPQSKRVSTIEKRSELVCRVKYCNTLPDIPFDPKFINYPFEANRYVAYNPTSLERNYKHDLLTEHDLGVTIDLILPNTYTLDGIPDLEPADDRLLEEDTLAPQDSRRSRHHAKSVSWLRRTEYISTEITRFQPTTVDKIESKVGFSIKKQLEDDLYMDRDSQIKAIEKTFEDVKSPVTKHYSKPGVVAVAEMQIFPDFDLWKYPCAQVIFDSDPAPINLTPAQQVDIMSQAMIRGVMDEFEEQFVAYFLPSEGTIQKRKEDSEQGIEYRDDVEYDYCMHREYNWNVKNKASKGYEENYFFVTRDDKVYYNELETRVRLSKRRQKGSTPSRSRLVVSHRPLNSAEFRVQRYRERQLEPPGDDDIEEESEDDDDDNDTDEDEKTHEASDNKETTDNAEDEIDDAGGQMNSSPGASPKLGSNASSRSNSPTQPGDDKSGSRSRSNSPGKSKSRSPSGSRSRSHSKSPSNHSQSKSPASAKSRSKSPLSSRSGSASSRQSNAGSKSPGSSRSRSSSGSSVGSQKSAASHKSGSSNKSGSSIRSGASGKSGSSRSRSASGSQSGSSGSDSGHEQKKKDEEEIFGSDSD